MTILFMDQTRIQLLHPTKFAQHPFCSRHNQFDRALSLHDIDVNPTTKTSLNHVTISNVGNNFVDHKYFTCTRQRNQQSS